MKEWAFWFTYTTHTCEVAGECLLLTMYVRLFVYVCIKGIEQRFCWFTYTSHTCGVAGEGLLTYVVDSVCVWVY
jgi:hypothetical protein